MLAATQSPRGLKKVGELPLLAATLTSAQHADVLELDELWSFVFRRQDKRWVWLAQCRRTRQIVAYVIGSRGEEACHLLWERVPPMYKTNFLYTDFWAAYAEVLPQEQHRAAGKGAGQTYHITLVKHRAAQQHPAPAAGTLGAAHAFVLEDRRHTRELLAVVLA